MSIFNHVLSHFWVCRALYISKQVPSSDMTYKSSFHLLMLSIMAPSFLISMKSNLVTCAWLLYFGSTCRQRWEFTCVYMCTSHLVISSPSGIRLLRHLTYVTRHQQCDHTQIRFRLDWLFGSNSFCSFPNSIRKKAQEN